MSFYFSIKIFKKIEQCKFHKQRLSCYNRIFKVNNIIIVVVLKVFIKHIIDIYKYMIVPRIDCFVKMLLSLVYNYLLYTKSSTKLFFYYLSQAY